MIDGKSRSSVTQRGLCGNTLPGVRFVRYASRGVGLTGRQDVTNGWLGSLYQQWDYLTRFDLDKPALPEPQGRNRGEGKGLEGEEGILKQ